MHTARVRALLTALVAAPAALLLGTQAVAQVTFYENATYTGRSFTTNRQVGDFRRTGLLSPAGSAVVERGQWEVCDDAWFSGDCVVLRPGRYPSLAAMGMSGQLVAVREVRGSSLLMGAYRFAPQPATQATVMR